MSTPRDKAAKGMDRQEAMADRRQKQKEREEKWVETQIIGFTAWINSYIQKRGKKVVNLQTDFQDGLLLVDFLELASNHELDGIDRAPKGKIQAIQNLSICLQFVQNKLAVRLLGITTSAVYDGNLKLILGMIWSIFRCPAITKLNVGGEGEAGDAEAQKGKKTFESQLLAWVQERVANYDLHPSDFKTSFNDGLVFGALIHSIDPTALNYDHFEADKPAENLKIAFDAALKAFQVPILLSVDDMTSDNADERSVVLYTSLLYHAWQAAGAKAADTQIKTKLQKEQESKERLRKELESLRQEVENAKGALNSKHASASGLSEENERLRKLLDYLQRRAKAADSAIVSLENKISTLDQLGGDGSKKLLHSRSANAFLEGSGNSIGGGNSSPSEKSFWDFRVSEDDGGKANILHSSSRQFLSLDGGAPVLGKDKTDSSDWHLVEHKGATALQNLSSNHYLKLNEDGSASMTENIDDALFDITTKSAYDARQKEQRDSAAIAAALAKAGRVSNIRHADTLAFITAKDQLSVSLDKFLSDEAKWEVVPNPDGSVSLKSTANGKYLSPKKHVVELHSPSSRSDWWLSRVGSNATNLLFRNKSTGEYLVRNADGTLGTSSVLDEKAASWSAFPDDVTLGSALVAALAAAGGDGLVQNSVTRAYVSNAPGVSLEVIDETSWDIKASSDGSITLKSKENGKYLSLSDNGEVSLANDSNAGGANWSISRAADGDIQIRNRRTGFFLNQAHDGRLVATPSPTGKASWIIKSDNGAFSSSGFGIGDRLLAESIAAALAAAGGNALVEHGVSHEYVSNHPSLSKAVEENTAWDLSVNPDGSLSFKSKENGHCLVQDEQGNLEMSINNEFPGAKWFFTRSPAGDLQIRNKASGQYLSRNDDGALHATPESEGKSSSWVLKSDNGAFSSEGFRVGEQSFGAALAAALARAGGNGLLQHSFNSKLVDNTPGLSAEPSHDSEWDVLGQPDGTLAFRSKSSGQYLVENPAGVLSCTPSLGAASTWAVSQGPKKDLVIKNAVSGNVLQSDDSEHLALSANGSADGEWTIKSDNGAFNSKEFSLKDRSLGAMLAANLEAAGGVALVQQAVSQEYVDNTPGTSSFAASNAEWRVKANKDGSISIQSNENGKFLSVAKDGHVSTHDDAASSSAHWAVARTADGRLSLRNAGTGDYLKQNDDGSLATAPSDDPQNPNSKGTNWVVKSNNGLFSSDATFEDFDMVDGFSLGDGISLRELEARNAALGKDIEAANEKVKAELARREELAKEMARLKELGDLKHLHATESEKTLHEMEERINALQKIFDAEKKNKELEDEARSKLERDLMDKETIIRDAMEQRERILKKLDKSQHNAEKEISKRVQREKELQQLEELKVQLQKRVIMSEKTAAGLESLKQHLEEHLQDMYAWREHHNLDSSTNVFDLKKLIQELEGKPLEQQMDYLDGLLQDENRCFQRIMKVQGDGARKIEEKIVKKGWLSIKGPKEWKQKWCVLVGQLLKYYSSEDTSQNPDGSVDLAIGCEVVRQKAIKEGKTKVWPLKLSVNTKDKSGNIVVRKLFLRAVSKDERHSWFAAISSTTSRINYVSETDNSGEKPDPRILSFISAGEATSVYELFVDFRPLSTSSIAALRKGILYHDELQTLSLQGAQIGDDGLNKLMGSLDKLAHLKVVRLSGNRLSSDSVAAALKGISAQSKELKELDLSHNDIDVSAIEHLPVLLKQNPHFHHLNLSGNRLGDDGAAFLANALIESQAVIPVLELSNNQIGDKGAKALAGLVNANTNIGIILLADNQIRDDGAAALATSLHENINVTNLDLSGNNIGPSGALALRELLIKSDSLHSLNLSSNPRLNGSQETASLLDVPGYAVDSLAFSRVGVNAKDFVEKVEVVENENDGKADGDSADESGEEEGEGEE